MQCGAVFVSVCVCVCSCHALHDHVAQGGRGVDPRGLGVKGTNVSCPKKNKCPIKCLGVSRSDVRPVEVLTCFQTRLQTPRTKELKKKKKSKKKWIKDG